MSTKKKTIIIVALLLVVFIGSISYALWSVTLEQTGSNVVKTGCFTVDMQEKTNAINLPEEFPVPDDVGESYSPFTFTIENTCTIDSSYSVNLEVETGSDLESQYVKALIDADSAKVLTDYNQVESTDENVIEKYQLTTGTLYGASSEGAGDGEKVTYDLKLWLDQDTPEDQMSKSFIAKIVVENDTTTVEKVVLLATADYSATTSDNVTVNYYSNGKVEIVGQGVMKDSEGIVMELFQYISQNNTEFATLVNQTSQLSEYGLGLLQVAVIAEFGGYKIVPSSLGVDSIDLSNVTNNDELYATFKTLLTSDTTLEESEKELILSLIKSSSEIIKKIDSITVSEGITSLGEYTFKNVGEAELTLPSTITAIESNELSYSSVNVKLPSSVLTLGKNIADYSPGMVLRLPENETYTMIDTYTFEYAQDSTIIIPKTITSVTSSAFDNAQNMTVNFECSKEDAPESFKWVYETGVTYQGFTVNWNYTE